MKFFDYQKNEKLSHSILEIFTLILNLFKVKTNIDYYIKILTERNINMSY